MPPSFVPPRSPWLILLPFMLTPVVSFLFRLANAMIAPELVAEFGLTPGDLGLVTAAFFVGFGAVQLPMGLALDRWGPRPVMVALLGVAVVGSILFALAPNWLWLIAGRLLMGLGMAGSVMGGLKAANLWFARERVPLLSSILFGMTGVGGMLATVPLAHALAYVDWRWAVLGIGLVTVLVALMIAVLVPTQPAPEDGPQPLGRQVRDLAAVFASHDFWRWTPMAMTGIAAFSAYLSLWAPVWLRDVAGYDREAQAWALFLLLAGTVVGNFAFGWLTQTLQLIRIPLAAAVVGGCALTALLLGWLALAPPAEPIGVWLAIALLFGCPIAIFAVVAQQFPAALAGRVNTAVNVTIFATTFAMQWGIGLILDRFPIAPDGRYSAEGHAVGLLGVAALQTLAILWYFLSPRRTVGGSHRGENPR
jgi:predicted MFS family arabinose efflux permease